MLKKKAKRYPKYIIPQHSHILKNVGMSMSVLWSVSKDYVFFGWEFSLPRRNYVINYVTCYVTKSLFISEVFKLSISANCQFIPLLYRICKQKPVQLDKNGPNCYLFHSGKSSRKGGTDGKGK